MCEPTYDLQMPEKPYHTAETLQSVIHSMLLGPYNGTAAWATTLGCSAIGHPSKPKSNECFCTARKP